MRLKKALQIVLGRAGDVANALEKMKKHEAPSLSAVDTFGVDWLTELCNGSRAGND